MYEKFGNFDSAEELNACAEGLKETGKIGAVRELAKENGIPEAFVTDYLSGNTEELVD